MPHFNDLFPSAYLRAADLDDDKIVVMDGFERADFDGESKPVLRLRDSKNLVLNKTNGRAIADLYGGDLDRWKGQAIILYATEVHFRGELVQAIRVRRERPRDNGAGETAPTLTKDQMTDLQNLYKANGWPKEEVKAVVSRLAGASSLNRIPQNRLVELQIHFGRKYPGTPEITDDDIPF